MDLPECDSGGISSTAGGDDVSSKYAVSFLESFLPAYHVVNQSAISSVADRYKAIKFAADASLAVTATGASWSDALSKELVEEVSGGSSSGDLPCEERLARSLEAGVTSVASSASIHEQTPVFDRADCFCEPTGLSDSEAWRMKDGNYLEHGKGLTGRKRFSLRTVRREGRNHWSRSGNQRFSQDASRLAILKTLSLRARSKRRLCRSAWKPRATLRKAKSVARVRGRRPRCPKHVARSEPERSFENGIFALQRLVPGGSNMDADVLLDEAADFVMFLKLQVQALQSVANAVDGQFGGIVPEA